MTRWLASTTAAGALPLVVSGCRVAAPQVHAQPEVHADSDIAATSEQFRLRMRGLVQPLTGEIVASADRIIASTDDPETQRNALLWKIEAVPALREALFQPDPVTALTDAWVMSFQMTAYFETGQGRAGLGDAHTIAAITCQHLEAEIARVAASLTTSGDVSKARALAQQWASEHPIRGSIAARESLLNRVLEREIASSFSAMDAVGSLTVSVDDLNRRLEVYSAQLMEQGRWQMELFSMDIIQELQVRRALPLTEAAAASAGRAAQAAERAAASLERVAPLADAAVRSAASGADSLLLLAPAVERSLRPLQTLPDLIANERRAAVEAVSTEVARVTAFAQTERLATLERLTGERIAIIREVRDTVAHERETISKDLDRLTEAAIDRAFLRAAQLCGATLAAVFVGLVVLLFLARRIVSAPRTAGR